MLKFGLRFEGRDVHLLRALARAVRTGERGFGGQAANVFEQAALAAKSGEPLVLYCENPMEAVEMAASYIRFGVNRPVIEELRGD